VRRPPEHLRLAALRESVASEQDLLRDYAEEAALMHELPAEETDRRFHRFLDVYHRGTAEGTAEEWAAIYSGDVEHTFIRLSKPYRFADQEVIPLVTRALREHARTGSARMRVLDFGGGSGNDAIVYARLGHEAHYADLLALKNTDVVARRFALRDLDIPVHDAGSLPAEPFDAITAIDVLEHIYDVEDATARLLARIPAGGLFCCANAFSSITYDGDHLDKNRVYLETFPALMTAAGFARVAHLPPLEVYRREGPAVDDIAAEEVRLRRVLYRASSDHCAARCLELMERLDGVRQDAVRGLPLHGTVVRGTGATAASAAPAGARDGALRTRAVALAVRYAPGALRRRRWRAREAAMVDQLARPAAPGQTLASLSDYAAVLRIAEHRLATLGEDG
jgi:hypothetical protein